MRKKKAIELEVNKISLLRFTDMRMKYKNDHCGTSSQFTLCDNNNNCC